MIRVRAIEIVTMVRIHWRWPQFRWNAVAPCKKTANCATLTLIWMIRKIF